MAPAQDNETFGTRIRRRRHERRLSQRRLAAQVGIDFTYLSKLENNQSGQSPGEDLIRRLAEELDEDPENLLAMAGKVPVDELRARAREDPEFARSLRRLPDVPNSRITGLVAPPEEMAAVGDAHIVATLRRSPGVSSFRSNFAAQQDEYLIGVVGERAHCDRLRDADAPLHDIHVPPDGIGQMPSADEIVRRCGISVAYRDGDNGQYVRVELEQMEDTSKLWRPREPRDRFPLVVLRATFPTQQAGQERRIELGYDDVFSNWEEGWWSWKASRPMFVSTITVDASDLARTCECRFGKFLPTFDREEDEGGKYVVHVSNWLLKGHGVTLTWWPITDRSSE